jgi:hypothetical protein
MKEMLESLSLGSGAVVVAICSALSAWLLSYLPSTGTRWIGCVLACSAIAGALYWLPVWLGTNDAGQYRSWSPLVVGVWFLAGLGASAIVLLGIARRSR